MASTKQKSILLEEDKVENGDIRREEKPVDLVEAVEIVVKSWAIVKQDTSKHGRNFYKRLFTKHPELMQLFSFNADINESAIREDTAGLKGQARQLMSMIDYAILQLHNLSELVPKLQEMGRRHIREYGVKPEHFKPFGECLLWTLKEGLNENYTRDVEAAWNAIYNIITDVMTEGDGKRPIVMDESNS